jgi:hypothetical protein
MSVINIDICGPSYSLAESQVTANQSSINMFPIFSNASGDVQAQNPLYEARGKATMLPTAGFDLVMDLGIFGGSGIDGCAGLYCYGGYMSLTGGYTSTNTKFFGIFKGRLIEISVNIQNNAIAIAPTDRGALSTVPSGRTPAKFSNNGNELFIQWGQFHFVYNVNTHVLTTTPAAAVTPNGCVAGAPMIDGYFFVGALTTSGVFGINDQFYSSSVNNGLVWNAANTARMQSSSDRLVYLAQNKSELWGFGTNTIEIWYDAANATGMPFSKRVGSDINAGTLSPYSIATVNDNLIWVDSRGIVVMSSYSSFFRDQSSGYNITKISDKAVDQWLNSLSTLQPLIASTYNDRGNIMYELTAPTETFAGFPELDSAGRTFVLNTNNMMWHEKQYTDPNTSATSESYTSQYAQWGNIILAGSYRDNNLYILNKDLEDYPAGGAGSYLYTNGMYTDNTAPIYRYRKTKIFSNNFQQTTVNYIEIKCLTGQIDSGTISMRYSLDSGFTWSDWLDNSLGGSGDYDTRVRWDIQATAQEWQLEFRVAIDGKWSIVEAIANVTEGSI